MNEHPLIFPLSGFLAGLLIWAIIYAARKGRERRHADTTLPSKQVDTGSPVALPPVQWLFGEDSPTGRRVLDCRAYALGTHLWTENRSAIDKWAEMVRADGSELAGQSPANAWLVDVDWSFDDREAAAMEAGMRPQVTEDLWRIDCVGSRLYFRRSWTGQLVFMTNWRTVPTVGAQITRIWVLGEDPFTHQTPDYVAAYVRHLIDTHLLGVLTPFPIPPDFPADDQKIAAFVFHSVGRRGWLAEYFSKGRIEA